jgi:hypothetical protein
MVERRIRAVEGIHACEKLAYVRWANEQKSDGTKTRENGETLIEEWKSFDDDTRVGILEEYQSRDWQPYSLSGIPEAEFDIEDGEESDVAISPTASEDSFILPDTARAEIAREIKDPYSEVDHEWRFVRTLYKRAPLKDPELYHKESGFGSRSSLYMSFDEAEIAQEVRRLYPSSLGTAADYIGKAHCCKVYRMGERSGKEGKR